MVADGLRIGELLPVVEQPDEGRLTVSFFRAFGATNKHCTFVVANLLDGGLHTVLVDVNDLVRDKVDGCHRVGGEVVGLDGASEGSPPRRFRVRLHPSEPARSAFQLLVPETNL